MIFEWLLNIAKNWYTGFIHRFNTFSSYFIFDFKIKFLSDDLPLMMHQNTEEDEKILSTENILTARTNHTSNAPLTERKESNDNDIFLDCNSESDDEAVLEELRMQCQEILKSDPDMKKLVENSFRKSLINLLDTQPKEHEWSQEKHGCDHIMKIQNFQKLSGNIKNIDDIDTVDSE